MADYKNEKKKSKVINDSIRSEVAAYRTAVDRATVAVVERISEPVCVYYTYVNTKVKAAPPMYALSHTARAGALVSCSRVPYDI